MRNGSMERSAHILADGDLSAVQEAAVEVHIATRTYGRVVALQSH